MSIRYVSRDNVDLRGESLENPRNVVVLWESPLGNTEVPPSDNDYAVEGLLVYTDNAGEYILWRRNATTFNPTTDADISPDGDFGGRGPYWEEISVGGGSLVISATPPTVEVDRIRAGDLWLDSTSGLTYIWNESTDLNPVVSQWIQTAGVGQPSPGQGILTPQQADGRYVRRNLPDDMPYSDPERANIRSEIGAINTQFEDDDADSSVRNLVNITFNVDGDEMILADADGNMRTFTGGGQEFFNVRAYAAGEDYGVGDILVTQRGDGSLQFMQLSGSDIINAPATPAMVNLPSLLTERDTELDNNRIAIRYARNFFTPPPDGSTEVLQQGQILHSNGKLWIARSGGDQTQLGTPGYDNLTNWIPLADVEVLEADPTGENLQEGRFWYNSSVPTTEDPRQPGFRYYDGSRVRQILNDAETSALVGTDIDMQRLEHHANTVGDFAIVQTATEVPTGQADVLDNLVRRRQDQADFTFKESYDSLEYDSDTNRLRALVVDPTLSATDAGRKAFLTWWTSEFNQRVASPSAGVITFVDNNGDAQFRGFVNAVGNRPGSTLSRGEAFIEIEITEFVSPNTEASLFTGNTSQWLQSGPTNPGETTNQYFYLADSNIQSVDEYFVGTTTQRRWTTEAENAILHQNAAYVGRTDLNTGVVEFNPRQVPVIWEPNTQYYEDQFVHFITGNAAVLYYVTADFVSGAGLDTTNLRRLNIVTNICLLYTSPSPRDS